MKNVMEGSLFSVPADFVLGYNRLWEHGGVILLFGQCMSACVLCYGPPGRQSHPAASGFKTNTSASKRL